MPHFTPEQREAARAIFEGKIPDRKPCDICGGFHMRVCPRIKRTRIVWRPDLIGILEQETEYWPPGQWEKDVLFADEVDWDGNDEA